MSLPPPTPQPPAGQSQNPDTTIAILTHAGEMFFGFIVPLVVYLIKKDEDPFTREHARQSLNFSISMTIYIIIAFALTLLIIGFFLLVPLIILWYVFPIIAMVKASKSEIYKYPMTIPFVK